MNYEGLSSKLALLIQECTLYSRMLQDTADTI